MKKKAKLPNFTKLYKNLGYTFSNVALLQEALRHRSMGPLNNERLEFLGDAILNVSIAEALFKQFPVATEGQLTRARASLVNGETLFEVAKSLALSDYLQLGPGELRTGGFRRPSILADTLEAIIAAICLDADFATAKQCLLLWFGARVSALNLMQMQRDPKTALQEYLQSRHATLPVYSLLAIEGEDHEQVFVIECYVADQQVRTQGLASNRRKAEQLAAAQALEQIIS